MPEMRSTVLRLERQIQLEQGQALVALHQAHEQLASAALTAGRDRGYLGADPFGALGQLVSPSHWEMRLGTAALELWKTFFACFRPDEAAFEAARIQERAGEVARAVGALAPGTVPDGALALSILQALNGLWEERHQAISDRLDCLIKDLTDHQSRLGSVDLQQAHHQDEMARAVQVVIGALGEFGEPVAAGTPPHQMLAGLVGRYRRELATVRRQAEEATLQRNALVDAALTAATSTTALPPLPGRDQELVDGIRRIADDRRRLDETIRELRTTVARMQAEQRELMEEVAERDRRLARHEFGRFQASDEDSRLTLYRRAFATLDAGGNAKPIIDEVRALERIITLDGSSQEEALRILDRQLAEAVKCLTELRKVNPIAEDPKRLRPRLIMGSRYDFRSVLGQSQALRDAARDLFAYVSRARWALGVAGLGKDLPRLRRVFKEMVELVATWREKLGDPPPVSISIRLDQGSGIIALPAILASDLETLLKRRGKAAAQASATIVPVFEECVALYHKSIQRAKGEEIPREDAGKRESSNQVLLRLAGELTTLGGILEAVFGEAADGGFTPSTADAALMADDHLMLLALQQIDVACEVLATLPGAPKLSLSHLPTGRGSERLLACARERVTWLEEIARYRYERAGQAR